MEFNEAPAFTRRIADYLTDEGYRALQEQLATNPEIGPVMPGSGGFRKLRWADAMRGKGKRGGLRLIYYYFSSDEQIWLMALYDKNEATDLSNREKKTLKEAIEAELAKRRAKRDEMRARIGRR